MKYTNILRLRSKLLRKFFFYILIVSVLSGCGQKGELIRPQADKADKDAQEDSQNFSQTQPTPFNSPQYAPQD